MQIIGPEGHFNRTEPAALALGYFDGVHIGHAAVIRAALAELGPTVVVTFRETAAAVLKGGARSLMSDSLREQVLAAMGVDAIAYLDFPSVRDLGPEAFVRKILVGRFGAGFVSCGFNYTFGRGGVAGPEDMARLCAAHGVRVRTVPPVCLPDGEAVSSTHIRRLVEEGRVEAAQALLGRPFTLRFPVVHGRELGRKLGVPTINQPLPATHVVPRLGVYVAAVWVDGRRLPAVADIGDKPTVGSDRVQAETHILGFEGDLYGREVSVELLRFQRDEIRFDSVEELARQMHRDIQEAGRYVQENRPVRESAGSAESGACAFPTP